MGGQVEIRRGFDAVLLDLESDVLAEAFEIVALLVIAFDGGLLKTVFPRGVLKNLTETELTQITSLDGAPLDVKEELSDI